MNQIQQKGVDITMDSSPAYSIILFIVFICISIMMYGFGAAVKNLNEAEILKKAEAGNRKAVKLMKVIDSPVRFINTIQLTAACMLAIVGYFQSVYFIGKLDVVLNNAIRDAIGDKSIHILSSIIVIAIILIIYLSFGVMVPKGLGQKYSNSFAFCFVNIIYFIMTVLFPITAVIGVISNLVLRVFGINPKDEKENVTEDEIISIVNEGHEQGILEEREAEMISNIMELDDKESGDIMTHRKNIVAVDGNISLEEAVHFMLDASNSRFPVYLDDIDNIIGIIHLRDAVECLHKENKGNWLIKDLTYILREAIFIPETRNIDTLFRQMQSEKIHMVVVIDEYGQTAGIVAMEDILEEIVGNILDEYDEDENNIVKQSENIYLVKGMTTLKQLEDDLQMEFSEDDYDTLNGYLISKLDRIPSEDDKPTIVEERYQYDVLAVENKMISLVKITINENPVENTVTDTE